MRRIVLLIIILHSSLFTLHSQTASSVFMAMPDSLMTLLTARNRRDLVDFYQNKMEAKVRNRLNDYVHLDTLTHDYLHLTLSQSSVAEMRLLETEDTTQIICVIQTVAAPLRDSSVKFYDTDWQRLYWIELPAPTTADFFSEIPDSVSREMQYAQRSVDDLRLLEVSVSPGEPIFEFKLAVDELAEDEKKVARRYVRSLRYKWTGNGFISIF